MNFHLIFLGVVLTAINCYGNQQIQMPEAGAFMSDEDLVDQIDKLRHNVSELWENFSALKSVLTETLNHLRVHQAELEETVHMLEHKHDDGGAHGSYTDDHHHHHSGEQHGSDSHSHDSDSHSHGSDSHSHGSDSHSHGDDDHHHHSGEQHSHGDDHSHDGDSHSHSGEQHSHGDDHYHRSYSHSYSSASHHHGDSHEKGDDTQQTQQEGSSMIEPLVAATNTQQHYRPHPHPAIINPLLLINDTHFNRPHAHHTHRYTHFSRSARNRTVVIPKVSEVGLYDFAVCNVQPNRAIPEDQQQDVMGRINLWQKKSGGPLNIHIRLQGFDVGGHHGHHETQQAMQEESANEIATTAGHRHGFHIHSSGDLSNGCQLTGPHFNPKGVNHGGPNALVRHVGDLGNIECDDHGNANIIFNDEIASLKGPYSIIGKSMVIHSGPDDFGLGGNDESLRTGNAGTRIACCLIEKVEKLPIRSYKFIKAANSYNNA